MEEACRATAARAQWTAKMGVVVTVSTTDESDKPEDLFSLVDQAKENAGQGHQNVVADPGFADHETLKKAECEGEE
jgi:hypothetical protein